jgi:cytochrome P450
MARKYPPCPRGFLGLRNIRDFGEHTLEFALSVHQKYGDAVYFRMGPFRAYLFFHPDHLREILVTHWKKLPKLRRQVKVLEQWDGQGLLLSAGELWQRQHRLVQPAFAPRRFANYAKVMVAHTKRRLEQWSRLPAGSEIPIDPEMNILTLEIISETLFGADVRSKSQALNQAVQDLSEISVDEMKRFFIPPKFLPTAHNKKKFRAIRMLEETIDGFIRARRASGADMGDLLSMLLLATDEESGQARMTDKQARDEAMVLFLAGHDTSASALTWTWYLLAQHPQVEQRLVAEIQSVLEDRDPTAEDIPKLKYLKQVIQESMRIYPPAIGNFARQNAEEIEIGGYSLPKNSFLWTFSYVTHRDPRWFPDPERFDPDRFSPEREKTIPQFAYFPFGGGPRICIGMHFAMMEIAIILAMTLRRYRLQLIEGQQVRPTVLLALRPAIPIRFSIRPR